MLHVNDSLVRITNSSFLNNDAVQKGGVMLWSSSILFNNTLILGNRFFNNTAIAGGIFFQASYNSTRKDIIDKFWPDMLYSTNGGNRASYGPLRAGVVNTLKCVFAAINVSGCDEIAFRVPRTGYFFDDESLYVSQSKVACCIYDIFGQSVIDRNLNHLFVPNCIYNT